jgi:hypothetical protein
MMKVLLVLLVMVALVWLARRIAAGRGGSDGPTDAPE